VSTTKIESTLAPPEPVAPAHVPADERRRWSKVLGWLLLAVVVASLAWAGIWRLNGGHWERVETASMGTSAPVGTLLWVEPTNFSDLKVGDFITFRPPGQPNVTYSHRVYTVNADNTISTKGEIAAPDPWRLHASDVVGRVDMRWWGVGWLVKAAPVLLIGAIVLRLLVWRLRTPRWKLPVSIVGASLLLAMAVVIYQPLTRAQQLAFVGEAGGARATYISTGLLPLRLEAVNGGHADLRAGQIGSILSTHADSHGKYPVSLKPHLGSGGGWCSCSPASCLRSGHWRSGCPRSACRSIVRPALRRREPPRVRMSIRTCLGSALRVR